MQNDALHTSAVDAGRSAEWYTAHLCFRRRQTWRNTAHYAVDAGRPMETLYIYYIERLVPPPPPKPPQNPNKRNKKKDPTDQTPPPPPPPNTHTTNKPQTKLSRTGSRRAYQPTDREIGRRFSHTSMHWSAQTCTSEKRQSD